MGLGEIAADGVRVLYEELHVLRTLCGFTHHEGMALTRSQRRDWIVTANRLAEESRARAEQAAQSR
jgi:hypothetical protein